MKSSLPRIAYFLEQNSVAHDALWVTFAESIELEVLRLNAKLDSLPRALLDSGNVSVIADGCATRSRDEAVLAQIIKSA